MTTLEKVRQRAESEARSSGLHLNFDPNFLQSLLKGLARNEERYGYASCPCRLASGEYDFDRDIICPCDYRDPDVEEHGCCYCSLYVSEAAIEGGQTPHSIPERRPSDEERAAMASPDATSAGTAGPSSGADTPALAPSLPVLRCRVCGYLCAREAPPAKCPICGADSDRFERFL